MATREAHFDYALSNDVVKLGGPFLDANGEMAGSLIIFEAADMLGVTVGVIGPSCPWL